ncbi:hypothetical protein GGX14DRAFT_396880 [Mycena pura]|uniref:Uncharacterized protein n=1 Tax=Mycena pura TaxID=153505 RepID=A0AAD6YF30_9AGAR|nr:hypothetical protein GGX14DRAFT_396880 [Mycena pura]
MYYQDKEDHPLDNCRIARWRRYACEAPDIEQWASLAYDSNRGTFIRRSAITQKTSTNTWAWDSLRVRVPATRLAGPTRAVVTICNTPTGRRAHSAAIRSVCSFGFVVLFVRAGPSRSRRYMGVTGTPSMQLQGVAIAEQSQVVGSVVGVTLESSGGKVEAAASWLGVERVAATAGKPGGSDSGPITD